MIDICMYGCRGCNLSCSYCMGPQKTINEAFCLDEERLYQAIIQYKKRNPQKSKGFVIWGGEPFLFFNEVKRTTEFIKSFFPNEGIMISTNGALLQKVEIRDFIKINKIKLQLSHDGIGQFIRSTYNPLEDYIISPFLADLANNNSLTINCIMNNKNFSIKQNINYFTKWMENNNCLESNLNIRFTPFNESNLTPDFNLSGDNLKQFITEYEELYIRALLGSDKDKIYKHFTRGPLKQVRKSNFEIIKWDDCNQCSKFYSGKTNYSKHIDTKGNYICCNLIDSGITPRGKAEKKIPTYCKECEFHSMRGCWPCPAADFPEKCEFKKAWMQFQERMLLLKKLYQSNTQKK